MSRSTPLEDVLAFAGQAALRCTPAEYVIAFIRDLVKQAIPQLENNRKSHRSANEDALTNVLLAYLYSAYPGASRETDANGHVDIALKHPMKIAVVMKGEAKIIGPKRFDWYEQGLLKLVGQYNSGRDGIALFICYCRLPEMYKQLNAYKKQIADRKTAYFVRDVDLTTLGLSDLDGVFVTAHQSSGNEMNIVHAWVNMHAMTDAQLAAAAQTHH